MSYSTAAANSSKLASQMFDIDSGNSSDGFSSESDFSDQTEKSKRKRVELMDSVASHHRCQGTEILTILGTTKIQYTDDHILGQGLTSTVYQGFWHGDIPSAVKRVRPKNKKGGLKSSLKNWQSLLQIREPGNGNIVTLYVYQMWKEKSGLTYYLAMELAYCSLASHIRALRDNARPDFEVEQRKLPGLIHGAAKGLKWMHDHGILHRDITPQSILIFKTSKGEIAKLGNLERCSKLTDSQADYDPMECYNWTAPEVIQAIYFRKPFPAAQSIDIFALGMTAHFAMSAGKHPFGESEKYGAFITMTILDEETYAAKLGHPHYSADNLFQWMMKRKPEQRPTINQVLDHPFFWTYDKILSFLIDIARFLESKKDPEIAAIRAEIDKSYQKHRVLLNMEGDWLKMIGEEAVQLLSKRKLTKGSKKYDGKSVMMLIELIRDKFTHCTDIVEDLITDQYFGEEGLFSEQKYSNYFLSKFPDLVMFLVCELVGKQNREFKKLADKHFPNLSIGSIVPTINYD